MRVFFSRFAKPYTLRYSYKTGVIWIDTAFIAINLKGS